MAKDCLTTQFKKVVNNDSLVYLGMIRVGVADTPTGISANRKLTVAFTDTTTRQVKGIGNFHFTNAEGTADYGKTIQNGVDQVGINAYTSVDSGIVLVPKYDLVSIECHNQLSLNPSCYTLYGNDLTYCQNLKTIEFALSKVIGKFDSVKDSIENLNLNSATLDNDFNFDFLNGCTTLKSLNVSGLNDKYWFPITYLNGAIGLTSLANQYTSVLRGNIEDLCVAQCASRESGTINITYPGALALNGTRMSNNSTVTFSATGCTVVSSAVTGTYTKATSTWSYA